VQPPPRLPIVRELARLAAPVALVQALQSVAALLEVAVLGRLQPRWLAPLALANGLFVPLSVFGTGVVLGMEPFIAQALGAGRRAQARLLLGDGLWLALLAASALGLPIALAPRLLSAVGLRASLSAEVMRLLWLRWPSLVPLCALAAMRSYLQALGRVRPLVIAAVIATLLQPALDAGFAAGGTALPLWAGPLRRAADLGLSGVALATFAHAAVQAALIAWVLQPAGAPRPPSRALLGRALAVGVPHGLQLAAGVGAFSIVGLLAARLGEESAAAHQLVASVDAFLYTAATGIGAAGAVHVARAVGASDDQRARRAGMVAFAVALVVMAAMGVVLLFAPDAIAAFCCGDTRLGLLARPVLQVAGAFQLFDGLFGVGTALLRATGDTRFTLLAYLAGYYGVGLPSALVLGFGTGLGLTGLWLGLYLGLACIAVALVARFYRRARAGIVPLPIER
jgi:MATE family multidrug resistance protein